MTAAGNDLLTELDAAERGFVLGVLLLHPGGGVDLAAALAPPSDTRCSEVLDRIAALPRPERVKLTRLLAREAVAPIPAGIAEVDQAVLADLVRDEPPEILRLLAPTAPPPLRQAIAARLGSQVAGCPPAPDLPAGDASPEPAPIFPLLPVHQSAATEVAASTAPVASIHSSAGPRGAGAAETLAAELVAELQRAVVSRIVPVYPAGQSTAAVPGTTRDLLALDRAGLRAELSRRGALVLGRSLRGAGRDMVLRAAALAGPPWADEILATAVPPDTRERMVGPGQQQEHEQGEDGPPGSDRAAALEMVAATSPATDSRETVTRLGARAAGAHLIRDDDRGLGGADQLRAVAQRLPPALGAELLSGAGLDPQKR